MKKIRIPKITFWRAVLLVILALGLYSTVLRFGKGLGAATNLSDQFPWGLWVGFDMLCGIGLAAGGLTIAAVIYIFNLKKYEPVVRPALMTAFLGYVLEIVAVLFDLGRPYRIWHVIIMWNPRSVMFGMAWCVMLLTTVLALEFSPVVFEKFRLVKPLKIIRLLTIPLVVAGVVLTILHQSFLGALFLIVPGKLHPLWYSPILPLFFFISAITVGLAMVIFESFLSSRAFGRRLEFNLLVNLGPVIMLLLAFLLLLRVEDLVRLKALSAVFEFSYESVLFLTEIVLGMVVPMILLVVPKIRGNPTGLFSSALLVVLGFVLNRMNVAVTGLEAAAGGTYFPSWMEITITLAIVGSGLALFYGIAKYFPVFPKEKHGTLPLVSAVVSNE
ncbi:MAG: NrfD/PsrC family molybdoenzyme membrane anchor subunit [bacterium]